MADSYHIIDGQVVPFHGGRKDTNTGAWRDATPLELQLQEQLAAAEEALAEAAVALETAREDAEPVVRFNDDGTLDEVVGRGQFHLEQMGSGHWWMQLGPHMVNLSARGKIRAHFGRNEAAIDQARGKGGQEVGNG